MTTREDRRKYRSLDYRHVRALLFSKWGLAGLLMAFLVIYAIPSLWNNLVLGLYGLLRIYRYWVWWVVGIIILTSFYALTRPVFWRTALLNRLALGVIFLYLRLDARGRLYYRIRQLLYLVRRREAISKRYEMVLKVLIDEQARSLEGNLLDASIICRNLSVSKEMKDRRMWLRRMPIAQIQKQVRRTATYRQTLARHYAPFYAHRVDKDRLLEAARTYDDLLSQAEDSAWISEHLKRYVGVTWFPTGPVGTLVWCDEALKCYGKLSRMTGLSNLEEGLVEFRLAVLNWAYEPTDSDKYPTMVVAFRKFLDRARIFAQDRDRQVIHFAIGRWVSLLALRGEYQAIIQTYRLLRERWGMFLTPDDYRRLGDAWWEHAKILGRDEYGQLAWQRALESYLMVGVPKLLEQSPPFSLE